MHWITFESYIRTDYDVYKTAVWPSGEEEKTLVSSSKALTRFSSLYIGLLL